MLASRYLAFTVTVLASFATGKVPTRNFPRQADVSCTTYTVLAGDTCSSISISAGITWAQLLSWNTAINKTCSNLADLVGDQICLSNPLGDYSMPTNTVGETTIATTAAPIATPTADGTNSYCGQYYLVGTNDDRGTITAKFGITLDDFIFLNSEIWTNCTNLWKDYNYCVQPVGTITTYSGHPKSTSTQPFEATEATVLPYVDLTESYSTNITTIPIANNTRLDCYEYFHVKNETETGMLSCWAVARFYGIEPEQFVLWNPSLSQQGMEATSTSQYDYTCELGEGAKYCVLLASPTASAEVGIQTPNPRASGEVANCTLWYQASISTSCDSFMAAFLLTSEEFYNFNPSIGSSCTGMNAGTYYCVSNNTDGTPPGGYEDEEEVTSTTNPAATSTAGSSTPSPVQTGMVSKCDNFYYVVEGDGCWAIANDNGITLDNFYSWNPAVGTDCSGLQANVYVCIGVANFDATTTSTGTATKTTTMPSTTSSTGGVSTPTPTQNGMITGCISFYKVVSGDGCWAIANSNGIALDDFYSWNPSVGTDCANLWPDYYVCVAV